jgi:hypothetical protein
MIILLLEEIVSEANCVDKEKNEFSQSDEQEISDEEAINNVKVFLEKIQVASDGMISNGQSIKQTSKQIRAISKILPFLAYGKESAIAMILEPFKKSI